MVSVQSQLVDEDESQSPMEIYNNKMINKALMKSAIENVKLVNFRSKYQPIYKQQLVKKAISHNSITMNKNRTENMLSKTAVLVEQANYCKSIGNLKLLTKPIKTETFTGYESQKACTRYSAHDKTGHDGSEPQKNTEDLENETVFAKQDSKVCLRVFSFKGQGHPYRPGGYETRVKTADVLAKKVGVKRFNIKNEENLNQKIRKKCIDIDEI